MAQTTIDITDIEEAEKQIIDKQRDIRYRTSEYPIGYLVMNFKEELIIIPEYQRKYVWKDSNKCRFIESLILGLPIPFLFLCERDDGTLEIIDGVQRISTLNSFTSDEFELKDLETLDLINGFKYSDLPESQQRRLKNASLRAVILDRTTDESSRMDLFERINTGSEELRKSEVRKGSYSGPFYNLIKELAQDNDFRSICPISQKQANRYEAEELVLRFFAYSDKYQDFRHSVNKFLDSYLKQKNKGFERDLYLARFHSMVGFVKDNFPNGFAKSWNSKSTPRVRFEAISVGVHLALEKESRLKAEHIDWLNSAEFKKHTTTHASNSRPKLCGRIEYVRDMLLKNNVD